MSVGNRFLSLLFVASLLTLVASCVESGNPASNEKTSKIDQRLLGDWKDDNGDVWKVTKSKDVENGLNLKLPDPKASDRILAFSTTIGSKGYLRISDAGKEAKSNDANKEAKKKQESKFEIYQYVLTDDDTLEVRGMDSKAIAKAIEDKQLVGKIVKKKSEDSPVITDTTEGIVHYLEAHADECFPEKTDAKMVFKRQK